MKIQLDSITKIIRIEENVNLGELIKYLDKLLPKNSPIGYWKDFKLETNTLICNWIHPFIYTLTDFPFMPTTCNVELSNNTEGVISQIYNVELN